MNKNKNILLNKIVSAISVIIFVTIMLIFVNYISDGALVEPIKESALLCPIYDYPSKPLFSVPKYDLNKMEYEKVEISGETFQVPRYREDQVIAELIYNNIREAITCKCDPERKYKHVVWFTLNGATGEVSNVKTDFDCDTEVIKAFPFQNIISFEGEQTEDISFDKNSSYRTYHNKAVQKNR